MEKIWIILLGVVGIIIVCLLNRKNNVYRTVGCIAVLLGCVMGLLVYFNISLFESIRTIVLTIVLTVILLVLVFMVMVVAGNYLRRKNAQTGKAAGRVPEKSSRHSVVRRKTARAAGRRRTEEMDFDKEMPEEILEMPEEEPVIEQENTGPETDQTAPVSERWEEKEELQEAVIQEQSQDVKKTATGRVIPVEKPHYAAGGKPRAEDKSIVGPYEKEEKKQPVYRMEPDMPVGKDMDAKKAGDMEKDTAPTFEAFLEPRGEKEPAVLPNMESIARQEEAPGDERDAFATSDSVAVGAGSAAFESFLDEEEEPFEYEPFEFADEEEMAKEGKETEKKLSVSLNDVAERFTHWQSGAPAEEADDLILDEVEEFVEEEPLWSVEETTAEEEPLREVYGEEEEYGEEPRGDSFVEEEETAGPEEEEGMEEPAASVEKIRPEERLAAAAEELRELGPHEKKQAEMGELKTLVAQKNYTAAIQKVFQILNTGYIMTPDEKQQMKLILLTLKEKTRI